MLHKLNKEWKGFLWLVQVCHTITKMVSWFYISPGESEARKF